MAQDEGGEGGSADDGQTLDRTDQMYVDVHSKLASKAIKAKNLAKGRAELNLVLGVAPRHAVTHYRMAILCAKMKDFPAAWRHTELARPFMEKHKEAEHFKKFEAQLSKVFPKPSDLSLDTPKEALPEPRFQAEAALVFLVQVAESKDIVSRIARFEATAVEAGAFTLTLIGSGPLDAAGVTGPLAAIPNATCEKATAAGTDSRRVAFKVTLGGSLPAQNPILKATTLNEYGTRRDEAAKEADLSLRNQRESEPDPTTGLARGTCEFIGRDLRGVLTMLNTLSDCLADMAILSAGPAEFNQQKVWKGEIMVQVKQAG